MHRMLSARKRLFFLTCIPMALALCLLLGIQPLTAAQSSGQKQSAQKNAAAGKPAAKTAPATAAAETRTALPAPDVYAQNPYTEKELVSFIESMPHFLAWVRVSKAKVHPAVNAAGRPDFAYTPEAAAKVRELGWEPRRFFCLLGRTAAALYRVEEGADLANALPPDMPTVTDAEMALVRKHLASLLRAGAGGPAPSLSR
jgi:hypothetical protein